MIGEETFVGELSIPMDAQLKLFDGQHRASGIGLAIQQAAELGRDSVPLQRHCLIYLRFDWGKIT